ncbi:MAG: hypothetical protein WCJ18_04735 [Planctomycetota bacterium]
MHASPTAIATFFEDIGFEGDRSHRREEYKKDILRTMELHEETFAAHGWRVVRVGMAEARRHPLHAWFDGLDWFYSLSVNPPRYTRICYMRWLAYASAGLPFADLDVINFGFTPDDARPLLASPKPALISTANAMGLLTADHYTQVIDTYRHIIENIDDYRARVDDVNDMTLLRGVRPDFNESIPYTDDRFVKDYSNPGWETARLVHFAHGLTPLPRSATIEKVLLSRSSAR